jgi:GT2 family glycosyltransferase
MQSQISVVILNYNTSELLEKLLPSVLATNYASFEVVLADNNSSDNSVQLVKEKFPSVRIIETGGNHGYPGGYNRALREIKSDYYVLLNSDVEVHPDWLTEMMSSVKENDWAAVQPKILDYNKRTHFEYAGACGGFIDFLGYPFCRGRMLDHLEEDTGQYDEDIEIFWATGAALMIESSTFWDAGGLDEDFFAHMEEIDLCWRLKNLGHKIGVSHKSKVYHIGGGTLSKQNSHKTYLNFRNGLVLLIKNLPLSELIWKFPFRLILDGLAGGYFMTQGHWKDVGAVIRAHWNVFLRFGFWTAKRRKVQRRSGKIKLYPKSLVLNYFINNKRTYSDFMN